MKKIVLALTLLISGPAFAQMDAEAIFSALNVEAESIPAARIESVSQKSIGGLTCVSRNHLAKGTSVTCSIDTSSTDARAIYTAMEVKANPVAAARIMSVFNKSIGGLSCTVTNHLVHGDSATCSLTF